MPLCLVSASSEILQHLRSLCLRSPSWHCLLVTSSSCFLALNDRHPQQVGERCGSQKKNLSIVALNVRSSSHVFLPLLRKKRKKKEEEREEARGEKNGVKKLTLIGRLIYTKTVTDYHTWKTSADPGAAPGRCSCCLFTMRSMGVSHFRKDHS